MDLCNVTASSSRCSLRSHGWRYAAPRHAVVRGGRSEPQHEELDGMVWRARNVIELGRSRERRSVGQTGGLAEGVRGTLLRPFGLAEGRDTYPPGITSPLRTPTNPVGP